MYDQEHASKEARSSLKPYVDWGFTVPGWEILVREHGWLQLGGHQRRTRFSSSSSVLQSGRGKIDSSLSLPARVKLLCYTLLKNRDNIVFPCSSSSSRWARPATQAAEQFFPAAIGIDDNFLCLIFIRFSRGPSLLFYHHTLHSFSVSLNNI